jgi:cysteine synthase A
LKAYKITDNEVIHMAYFLIENEGLLLGPSSALNCCAIVKAVRELGNKKRIVTIFCDSGNRYLSKFYNQSFLEKWGIKF